MHKLYRILLFLLVSGVLSAQDGPIGWASVDGGTTGGEGGEVVMISSRAELLTNVRTETPRILMIQDTVDLDLYERVKVSGNKTIIGATPEAMIRYGGLEIIGNNVIIQNLSIGDFYDGDPDGKTNSTDCLTLYGQHIWVDHVSVFSAADGLIDARSGNGNVADYITLSNVKFSDHNKVSLIGSSDDEIATRGHLRITFYNCWFDGTVGKGLVQRLPRVRFGDVHVLNSYYEDVSSYCVAARFESDVVVENNYFRNSKNPHAIEDKGQGIEDPDLVAIDNIYEATSGSRTSEGEAFVPGDSYAYTALPANEVPATAMNEAGPFNKDTNQPPTANVDSIDFTQYSGAAVIDVLANDTDPDGGDLRIAQIANQPAGLVVVKNNQITFVAPSNPTGVETIEYVLVDTQGGVDRGTLLIFYEGFPNAIDEIEADSELINIYPNPTRGPLTIKLDRALHAGAVLSLFDSNGRQLSLPITQGGDSGHYQLETGSLAPGVYNLLIRSERGAFSKRFVVSQ